METIEPVGSQRPVVQVDKQGFIIKRFASVKSAAYLTGMGIKAVATRCRKEIASELKNSDYTFRYADKWDRMNRIEKLRDLGVDVGG